MNLLNWSNLSADINSALFVLDERVKNRPYISPHQILKQIQWNVCWKRSQSTMVLQERPLNVITLSQITNDNNNQMMTFLLRFSFMINKRTSDNINCDFIKGPLPHHVLSFPNALHCLIESCSVFSLTVGAWHILHSPIAAWSCIPYSYPNRWLNFFF